MKLFSMFKRNSRVALKGNWGRALCALAIPAGAGLLLSLLLWGATLLLVPVPAQQTVVAAYLEPVDSGFSISARPILLGIYLLLGWLLVAPLQLGATYWYRALVHGTSLPAGEVFFFFKSRRLYLKAVLYHLSLSLRATGWAALFLCLPGGALLCCAAMLRRGGERAELAAASLGLILSLALLLIACLGYLVFMNRYLLAPYLLCEHEGMGIGQAIRTSVTYTEGFRFQYLFYGLSFLGWHLLGSLTLGLACLFTSPYWNTAVAMFGRYAIEKNRYIPPEDTREFVV